MRATKGSRCRLIKYEFIQKAQVCDFVNNYFSIAYENDGFEKMRVLTSYRQLFDRTVL